MRLKVPFFRYLLMIAGLLLPSVIFLALLPSLINAEPVKARLIAELREWTGAEVSVAGPVAVDNFFSLSIDLRDVEFRDMKAVPGIAGIKAGRLVARIAWSDLLFGNLDFDKIKVHDAAIRTRPGEPQRSASALLGTLAGKTAPPGGVEEPTPSTGVPPGAERIVLVNGATANIRKADGRLELAGSLTWDGEAVRFRLSTNRTGLARRTDPVPLNLTMDSRLLSAGFNGQVNASTPWSASGYLALTSNDVPALSRWLGWGLDREMPANLQLTGSVQMAPGRVSLDAAALALAGQRASGEMTARLRDGGARLQGALAFDELNLAPMWQRAFGEEAAPAAWPQLLSTVEMDLRISTEKMRWHRLLGGPAAFTLTAHSGRLMAEIAELGLFDGSVLGHLEADLAKQPPRAQARLAAENLDMSLMSQVLALNHNITGRADARFELDAEGRGGASLLQAARGRAKISFADGGTIPLDIPLLASLPPAGRENGWGGQGLAETRFDDLLMRLDLQNGQLRCQEMTMLSGGEVIRGSGSIDLAKQELDWHFTVRKAAAEQAPKQSLVGQGGGASPEASLSIQGPWARPVIRSGERSGALPTFGIAKPGTAFTAIFPQPR